MTVLADSSALFALLTANDLWHREARVIWKRLRKAHESMVLHSYALQESVSVVQRRLGMEAARELLTTLVPVLDLVWIDGALHAQAEAAFLTAGRRALSLVDCTSFALMRQLGIDDAFAFDGDFEREGFRVLKA